MNQLVFFLEGHSERSLLEGLMPRLAPSTSCQYICFEGKQDLEKQQVRKLQWYQAPVSGFVVLRDSGCCRLSGPGRGAGRGAGHKIRALNNAPSKRRSSHRC